ncbi:hypothetical protein DIE04_18700 [Burkholderia sp. Bp8994]|nr:hypothetical protein DIE20_04335 [Burkholderia sp. Bp9131]RQR77570.1 hypothetical protein DIE12_04665 [Burkholderia sp. Bp9015]RQR94490.1 hypothetical protein DIE04_18700 [Burkholderia sp. Bp8994]RQS32855.1 hypothetical protein DIE05_04720 [Burkholderia sp. Bp8995]RQS36042.1 hypothetical protein DIE01_25340 [Burkholderia sp. Bp8990]RQS49919.1 hypothetical protein DIE00_06430 [Burkholderia sp. Bp8989]RQZ49003.1 hypothetical protein DIE17_09420 [Burkholderia sp. Bp9099]
MRVERGRRRRRRQVRRRAATAGDRPDSGRLREWADAGVKRKAIENEPNGDPNDSAPGRLKAANPLFVL